MSFRSQVAARRSDRRIEAIKKKTGRQRYPLSACLFLNDAGAARVQRMGPDALPLSSSVCALTSCKCSRMALHAAS